MWYVNAALLVRQEVIPTFVTDEEKLHITNLIAVHDKHEYFLMKMILSRGRLELNYSPSR